MTSVERVRIRVRSFTKFCARPLMLSDAYHIVCVSTHFDHNKNSDNSLHIFTNMDKVTVKKKTQCNVSCIHTQDSKLQQQNISFCLIHIMQMKTGDTTCLDASTKTSLYFAVCSDKTTEITTTYNWHQLHRLLDTDKLCNNTTNPIRHVALLNSTLRHSVLGAFLSQ